MMIPKLTLPKPVCQIYLPGLFHSYSRPMKVVRATLYKIKESGFWGVYLIGLFQDAFPGDYACDITHYYGEPYPWWRMGPEFELADTIKLAHTFGLRVGVDVAPGCVPANHDLVERYTSGIPRFKDCLIEVSESEAKRLTEAGVPSFSGKSAYALIGDCPSAGIKGHYVRTMFADDHPSLNWNSAAVQRYFRGAFEKFREWGIDFVRVSQGMMLFEDVSKADPNNPMACAMPKESVEAVRKVAGGMPLFFECFDPEHARLLEGMPECYAVDCSFVLSGKLDMENWNYAKKSPKLVPLVGGPDQMTLADRGISLQKALWKMVGSEYAFLDLASLLSWRTNPNVTEADLVSCTSADFDINQRYRGRRRSGDIYDWFLYYSHH